MALRNQHRLWIIAAALLAAAGAGGVWFAREKLRPERLLMARLESQLASQTGYDLELTLAQLAAFGEEGIEPLARAIRHERTDIAENARLALSTEIENWHSLAAPAASRRAAKLATCLADGIKDASPLAKQASGDLAARLLLVPLDTRGANPAAVIADCERVLASCGRRETESIARRSTTATIAVAPVTPATTLPTGESLDLPGGALPVETQQPPALPPADAAAPRTLPTHDEPQLLPGPSALEESQRFDPQPADRSDESAAASPMNQDLLAVVYRLGADNARERDSAEDALRTAGFGEAQLAVARRFADPRADVRLALVEQLARQRVVDPKPWLLKLLADRDRGVRLAAAAILATSSDPAVALALRRRAIEESDIDVRAVLTAGER